MLKRKEANAAQIQRYKLTLPLVELAQKIVYFTALHEILVTCRRTLVLIKINRIVNYICFHYFHFWLCLFYVILSVYACNKARLIIVLFDLTWNLVNILLWNRQASNVGKRINFSLLKLFLLHVPLIYISKPYTISIVCAFLACNGACIFDQSIDYNNMIVYIYRSLLSICYHLVR